MADDTDDVRRPKPGAQQPGDQRSGAPDAPKAPGQGNSGNGRDRDAERHGRPKPRQRAAARKNGQKGGLSARKASPPPPYQAAQKSAAAAQKSGGAPQGAVQKATPPSRAAPPRRTPESLPAQETGRGGAPPPGRAAGRPGAPGPRPDQGGVQPGSPRPPGPGDPTKGSEPGGQVRAPQPAHEPASRMPPGPTPTRRTASGPGRPRPPQAARQEPASLARIHSKRERRVARIKWGILALVAVLIIGLAVGHEVSKKSPSATQDTGNTVATSPATHQPVTEGATATGSGLEESTLLSVPAASAVAQGDGKSFVTDDKRNLLLRFDPATGKVQGSLSLLGRPDAMIFTGNDLWIAEMVSNEVIEVNPNTLKVVQVVNVPAGPSSLSVLNGDVWVTSVLASEITPIDIQTGVLGTPVQVLSGTVRATSGYNALWVSGTENLVTRIVPAPNNDGPPAQHALKVGQGPVGIAAGAGSVWVANSQDGTVSQVDPTSLEVTATLPVGPDPLAIVVTPDNHVYAGLGSAQTVRVVSPAPESKALGVKGEPRALLAVGTGGVWVATSDPGKVLAVS